MTRACIYIDHGYLQKLFEDYRKRHIDYLDFSEKLCENNATRFRTYIYDCMPFQSNPSTPEEKSLYAGKQKFFTALNRIPRFEIRFGKLQKLTDSNKAQGFRLIQKRVDVLMSVDIVRMSIGRQIERAILVTGDSDLVPAVKTAKDAGVEVYVWYGKTRNCTIHDELLQECDVCKELTRSFIKSIKSI